MIITCHACAVVIEVLSVVIARALLGVAEHAVGLADLLEAALLLAPLRVGRARVPVRVVHQGALPVTIHTVCSLPSTTILFTKVTN